MRKLYFPALVALTLSGCTNLEDAELTERNTFIRFYEGANSMVAADAVEADGGYVIAGTIRIEGDVPDSKIRVIKTDRYGSITHEQIIDNGSVTSLKVTPQGFLVVGEQVIYNPNSDELADITNTSSRLLELNRSDLSILTDNIYDRKISVTRDDVTSIIHIDYKTSAITEAGADHFITLGTHKRPGTPEVVDITKITKAGFDTTWTQKFDYLNRDYKNTNSVYYNQGNILWGASITETINIFNRSYLAIPVVQENSTFINSNYYGQFPDQQYLRINDLKPGYTGFAAIGTYSDADGGKSNLLFIRVDNNGNFIPGSVRFYDSGTPGFSLGDASSASEIQDNGEALTPTVDGGFVLAGSTTNITYGGFDIWLLKVNAAGDVVWSKVIGGRSSEVVTSIHETADGGFILSGTLTEGSSETGGLSSVFMIKTDSNGELKD